MFLFSLKSEVFEFSLGRCVLPLNSVIKQVGTFFVALRFLVKFHIGINTWFICIYFSFLFNVHTHKHIELLLFFFFFFFFFHHTTCEGTCDTLASSAANQGDNTVSVAQGGTATLALPSSFCHRIGYLKEIYIYVYTRPTKMDITLDVRSSSFWCSLWFKKAFTYGR